MLPPDECSHNQNPALPTARYHKPPDPSVSTKAHAARAMGKGAITLRERDEEPIRHPQGTTGPGAPASIRDKFRAVGSSIVGLVVFFGAMLCVFAVWDPSVDISSSSTAVVADCLHIVPVPMLLASLVCVLLARWRPGWRLGLLFGIGVVAVNFLLDLFTSGQGPIAFVLTNDGADGLQASMRWVHTALLALEYIAPAVVGGLIADGIRLLIGRRGRAGQSGLHAWHVGTAIGGVVVVLAVVSLLLSSPWSSAWATLYGSGGNPEDWANAEELVTQGEAAEAGGNVEEALALYSEAIATEPGYASGWSDKTDLLVGEGRLDEALESAEGWASSLPKNSSSWFYKGYALESLGRYEDAIVPYEKSIALDEADGRDTEGTTTRLNKCKEILANPEKAAEEAYFDRVASLMGQVREANQATTAIFDTETAEEAVRLLADYVSQLDECIEQTLAIEPPARLVDVHAELANGLQTMRQGAVGMSSALQSGDSGAFDRSSITLLRGSDKIEAYRLFMLDELSE